jgi:hypothetical protein
MTLSSRHCIIMTLYHHDTVSSRHCIIMTLYHHDTVSSWHCITMTLYHHDTVSSWHCIIMTLSSRHFLHKHDIFHHDTISSWEYLYHQVTLCKTTTLPVTKSLSYHQDTVSPRHCITRTLYHQDTVSPDSCTEIQQVTASLQRSQNRARSSHSLPPYSTASLST